MEQRNKKYTIKLLNPFPLSPGLSGLQAHSKPTYAQSVFLGFKKKYWEFYPGNSIFGFLGLEGFDLTP
jgi:hypothetical protein